MAGRRARRSERYDGPDSRPEASEYSSYSDDSYGDDSYGDDSYGDDSYGDDSYSSYSSYVSSEDEESVALDSITTARRFEWMSSETN